MRQTSSLIKPLLILGVFLTVTFHSGDAGRVLLVPVMASSHVNYFAHFAKALIDRGHEVYAVMNKECRKASDHMEKFGVTNMYYTPPTNGCYYETRFDQKSLNEGSEYFLIQTSVQLLADAEPIMNDPVYLQSLKALKFDLSVVDGMGFTAFHYLVPYKLDIPHVTLTTSFFGTWANVPALPSFTPFLYNKVSDRMTFTERVQNTINQIHGPMKLAEYVGSLDQLVSQYVPEKPFVSFRTLQRKSKLWFVNTDPVLDYPRVSLPHIVHVGGLTVSEGKPLPDHLNRIVKEAKAIAVVSFGSMIHMLPMNGTRKLLDAFKQFEDVTFIFKYRGPELKDVPRNVHIDPWLPQNDLLAHPKSKLFVTHCGNNGQFEAVFHAVPMIGLPVFGDQFYGSHRMAVKGYGIALDAADFTQEAMVHSIREILTNESYEIAIDRASEILQDQPLTPKERVGFWVDHIIRFGADHLISAGVELPWYQFWLVDVMALFLSIAALILVALVLLIWAIVRSVTSTPGKKTKKD